MKIILRFLLIFVAIFCLPDHLFWQCSLKNELSFLKYNLPNEKDWVRTNKSLIDGTAYFLLQRDESIKLKSVIMSRNLYQEAHRKSEKEIVESIFNKKKNLFRVLGASEYRVNSYKMVNKGVIKELSVEFQFFLKSKMSFTHERYFIHPEQTLMMDLSWSSISQEKQLQYANREFAKIQVTIAK
jgi:hypothetical protein